MVRALFTNNAYSTLASGINDSVTTLTVASGHGARFPSLSGGNFFYATLVDTSDNIEIIKVTARSTDSFTIERGKDNTSANAYLTGDRIELRITAAGLATHGELGKENTWTERQIWAKGTDIASATPTVPTDGNYFDVTGTTTIAAFTVTAGTLFMLQFDGAVTLTHDGTDLDLPGEADITTAAGDTLIGFAKATDDTQVLSYTKADGTAVVGAITQANQTAIEAETNENTYVPPDLIKHNPGVAKASVEFDGTAVDGVADLAGVSVSNNISSVVDVGTGNHTINFTTAFSTADYTYTAATRILTGASTVNIGQHISVARTASAFRCATSSGNTSAALDSTSVSFAFFGDQ